MKRQTAAQLRAAQAVVDREEAIEAERERRRAERTERNQRAASDRRAAFIASVRVSSRPLIASAKDVAKVFVVIELVSVCFFIFAAFVLPSLNGYPLPFEQRVQFFLERLPTALLFFPLLMSPFFINTAKLGWIVLPWLGLLILALLLLKFAVFPLVRLIIQKVRS